MREGKLSDMAVSSGELEFRFWLSPLQVRKQKSSQSKPNSDRG